MLAARAAPSSQSANTPLPSVAQRRYDGRLQRQITQALCANPAIGAGRYRIALRFSVSNDQRLHQIRVRVAERRSEEHTSELQSLMRISYAVFCLKKKTKH